MIVDLNFYYYSFRSVVSHKQMCVQSKLRYHRTVRTTHVLSHNFDHDGSKTILLVGVDYLLLVVVLANQHFYFWGCVRYSVLYWQLALQILSYS